MSTPTAPVPPVAPAPTPVASTVPAFEVVPVPATHRDPKPNIFTAAITDKLATPWDDKLGRSVGALIFTEKDPAQVKKYTAQFRHAAVALGYSARVRVNAAKPAGTGTRCTFWISNKITRAAKPVATPVAAKPGK